MYSGSRVLTTHELKPGEVLHSGVTGGKCASFKVVTASRIEAVLAIGGGTYSAHGTDFRKDRWYRAESCPVCLVAAAMGLRESRHSDEPKLHVNSADKIRSGNVLAVKFLEARPVPPRTRDWNLNAHNQKPDDAIR
jgi:hypothetical protein